MNLGAIAVAGYDTMNTTLGFCLHTLAKYPEEQEKLFNEIEEHFPTGSNVELNTENIKELKYMHHFIDEVLRLNVVGSM